MTAEKARLDPVAGAANLNALQWGWFATGGLLADSVAGPIYNYMVANHSGAQSCFMFSGYTFLAMAACGLLYKDETDMEKIAYMRDQGACSFAHSRASDA